MTTATIKLWRQYHDEIPDEEPAVEETVEVYEGDLYSSVPRAPPHGADTFLESEDVHNHQRYDILVEADEPVMLYVHSNDSVHHAEDWGKPVEFGMGFDPDNPWERPFGCEMWGRVIMWAAARGDGDGE